MGKLLTDSTREEQIAAMKNLGIHHLASLNDDQIEFELWTFCVAKRDAHLVARSLDEGYYLSPVISYSFM